MQQYQPLIMLGLIIVIMWFFIFRPQQKKQKEIQKFRNSLSVGQQIITIGGIHGTVKSINENDNTVSVEVASGIKMTFSKDAINPTGEMKK